MRSYGKANKLMRKLLAEYGIFISSAGVLLLAIIFNYLLEYFYGHI
jgi:hypothetical protein